MTWRLVVLLALVVPAARCQQVVPARDPVRTSYAAGRYRHALQLLQERLAATDLARGPIYYDLGNCAFRLGRYAEAVLWYRAAQRFLPGEERVRFNLSLAQRRLGIQPRDADSFFSGIRRVADRLGPWKLLLLSGALNLLGLLGWVLLPGRRVLRALLLLCVLVGTAGLLKVGCEQLLDAPREAVVLQREAGLHSEPHVRFATGRSLGAGRIVRVLEASDRWVHVRLDGESAWLRRRAVGFTD